jgi:hypothetical protein
MPQPQEPQNNPELEALLVQNHEHAQNTEKQLETLITQGEKNNPEPILEAAVLKLDEISKTLRESKDTEAEQHQTVADSATVTVKGLKGDRGDTGEKGDTGEQGSTGPVGPQGLQGEAGEQGPQGGKGDRGIDGLRGIQGERGEQGFKGDKGDKGDPGKDGTEIASEDIISKISGKFSYDNLKDLPHFSAYGGPSYLRELPDVNVTGILNGQALKWDKPTSTWIPFTPSGGGAGTWGSITGTLSDQTDLQTALNAKLTKNSAITGATKTKITFDANGLVTVGADATTADIADSTNARYVTDAQRTVIQNTSGTNTGDQTISDATISMSDITTNNVSISKHGFAPKLPNDATKYLDGTGAFSTPTAGGAAWGSISGTLSSQTDLQAALDAKMSAQLAIVYAVAL